MSGSEKEKELGYLMSCLGWRATHLGEKGPAVDYLCIFPDPETPGATSEPGMAVYIQVKSGQQPTASVIGIKNLLIFQLLQVPIFWYCVSPADKRSRTIYHLSPEWLENAITSQSRQPRAGGHKLLKQSIKGPIRSDRPCEALHRFIKKCYESFLRNLSEAALIPFVSQRMSSKELARHIEATANRFRGLRDHHDLEACLEAAKLYRVAGEDDKAAGRLLQEAEKLLEKFPVNDTRYSRYWYELSYRALVQGNYSHARKWAKLSSTGGIRKPIADAVRALSYYLPVLKSGRLIKGYDDKVLMKLKAALDELRGVYPSSKLDRDLKNRWLHNLYVHLAEAHGVYSILASTEIDSAVVRDFEQARKYWLRNRLIDGISSCLFVEALLAVLRKDRLVYEISRIYFNGIKEGDVDRFRSIFLDTLNSRSLWS